MNRLLLPLLAPLLLLGGCASIPPDALTHMAALKNYHKKAAVATLGVYDSSIALTKYTLETWKQNAASRTQEYVAAEKEASDVFAATKATVQEISDLLAQLPGADAARQAEIRTKAEQKIKVLQDELATRKSAFDRDSKDAQDRSTRDTTRFNQKLQELDSGGSKLRALITESADTTLEGLAKQEALLTSYLGAQSKMKQVFGPQLSASAASLAQEASQLAGKYAPLISSVESILK